MQYKYAFVIGITGGIGCGQTSVGKFLTRYGVKVINADRVAREVVDRDTTVRKELRKAFGNRIFHRNGRLNRQLLARIVFEDEAKTLRLNRIVHPRMVGEIIERIEKARELKKYPFIAIDAALIYELNLEHMFDAIVVVSSKMSHRIKRIKERDGLSEREIVNRINKQIPIEDKMQWADYVIENNGSLEELEKKTDTLYRQLVKDFRQKRRGRRIRA